MVVAGVAYDVLKQESPQTITRVLALLQQHPQYNDVLKKRILAVPAEDQERYAFMVAARWADDIRDDKDYSHPNWHYVDFQLIQRGDEKAVPTSQPDDENALTAIDANGKLLLDTSKPAADRAVALCWMMHLVGDVHQPLHCVSFYNKADWPKGDRGGNLVFLRAEEGKSIINLHQLWDGLVLSSEKYRDAANEATQLRNNPLFAKNKLTELSADRDPRSWAQESFRLDQTVAYPGGRAPGSADRSSAPTLPDGYLDKAKSTAERRVVLAGYRLAAALEAIH